MKKSIILSAILICNISLFADENEPKIDANQYYNQVMSFYKNENYQNSYEYLKNYQKYQKISRKDVFIMARSAYEIRKFVEALGYYEYLLKDDKDNIRIKLEIAQCHLQLKNFDKSKAIFQEILKTDLPATVRKNVEIKLKELEVLGKKHSIKTVLAGGILNDSNIDSQKDGRADYASQLALVSNYNYRINDNISIENRFLGVSQSFSEYSEKDIGLLSFSTIPTYRTLNDRFALEIGHDMVFLGGDSYLNSNKISPKVGFKINDELNVLNSIVVSKKNYLQNQNSDRDYVSYELEQSYDLTTKDFGLNGLSLSFGKDSKNSGTRTDIDKNFYKLTLMNRYNLYKSIFMTNTASYQKSKYSDETNNLLYQNIKRDDSTLSYDIGLSMQINKQISLSTGVQYTNNSSNIDLYDYDKILTKGYLYYAF